VPWDEIAFVTVRRTLNHYFADRRSGEFRFHMGTVNPTDQRPVSDKETVKEGP
jgi:hypothetical protein